MNELKQDQLQACRDHSAMIKRFSFVHRFRESRTVLTTVTANNLLASLCQASSLGDFHLRTHMEVTQASVAPDTRNHPQGDPGT